MPDESPRGSTALSSESVVELSPSCPAQLNPQHLTPPVAPLVIVPELENVSLVIKSLKVPSASDLSVV